MGHIYLQLHLPFTAPSPIPSHSNSRVTLPVRVTFPSSALPSQLCTLSLCSILQLIYYSSYIYHTRQDIFNTNVLRLRYVFIDMCFTCSNEASLRSKDDAERANEETWQTQIRKFCNETRTLVYGFFYGSWWFCSRRTCIK